MLERIMDLHILLYLMAVLGTAGGVGMLAVYLTYRRTMRKTKATTNLREKWLNLWKTRDKLLNRMNLLVWIPSLLSTACLGLSLFFVTKLGELVTNSLADYILQARSRRENPPTARKYEPQQTAQKTDPVLREEMVERIASSIRQTAATGSHFSKMLSPEEEEIMREIIREFME